MHGAPKELYPDAKVAWMDAANEARYLTGILGLTGGLVGAINFFLHPFLRGVFEKLGGTTKVAEEAVTPIINRLTKASRSKAVFDLRNAQDVKALSNHVVKAARSLKSSHTYVGYEDLVSDWSEYRQAFWQRNRKPEPVGADAAEFDRHEEESLDRCLIEMRRQKIFFQGHSWLCSECHHRNWLDISNLAPEISCSVCRHLNDAPVAVRWRFRPNSFVIDALRDHSMLSLIWTLSELGDSARRSFMFVGPRWYGFSHDSEAGASRSPNAESDLIAIVDGQVFLCEVKASWRALKRSDISDLVALAKRLRPDVALLAVMEDSGGPTAELAAARADLGSADIEFRVMKLDPRGDRHDSPHLF